jgi:hypothetical protein
MARENRRNIQKPQSGLALGNNRNLSHNDRLLFHVIEMSRAGFDGNRFYRYHGGVGVRETQK